MSVLEAGGFVQLVRGWGDLRPLFLFMAFQRGSWEVDDASQLCLPLPVWDGEGDGHGEFLVSE